MSNFKSIAVAGVLLALGLAGCTGVTPPTRYYQLSPLVDGDDIIASPTRLLGVSPVNFPDYLDRPQIVTRASDSRITIADFDQWSAQFGQMFKQVLVEDFRRKLGGVHVAELPNDRGLRPSIELDLNVLRFDVDTAGKIVLDARWRLFDGDDRLLATRHTELFEQAAPGDYGSVVDGMSRAIAALSETIVQALPDAVGKSRPSNERKRTS